MSEMSIRSALAVRVTGGSVVEAAPSISKCRGVAMAPDRLGGQEPVGNAVQMRQPQMPHRGPRAFRLEKLGGRRQEQVARRRVTRRNMFVEERFEHLVNDGALEAGIRLRREGVERGKTEDPAGIDRVGVADQGGDIGHR